MQSPARETNPANNYSACDPKEDDTDCDYKATSKAQFTDRADTDMNPTEQHSSDGLNKGNKQDESQDQNNDSSTLSTAFTVSFEDDKPFSKKLGIRDSIRKFAPPKPHTIEKPRPPKEPNQDSSLMSVESAPAGFAGQNNFTRGTNARRSTPSRSNISESAAFLIDKMLNCQRPGRGDDCTIIPSPNNRNNTAFKYKKSPNHKNKHNVQSNVEVLEDEVDYCEEMSDNGTYIVGNDPETDAARKRMDELFGVVKAAEASLLNNQQQMQAANRPSRSTAYHNFGRERQERINRLATRNPSASRSSSSSRQETLKSGIGGHQPRVTSRNSSCDRTTTSRPQHGSRKPRSVSQSSRHSNGKEVSDTRSSRSSLHNDIESMNQEQAMNPSMKFNRAFTLRRARLGLGEPVRDIESNQSGLSPKRSVNPVASKCPGASNSSGSGGLSRNDGGRFSLRTKNNALSSRLSQLPTIARNQLPNSFIENYVNRNLPPRGHGQNYQQTHSRNATGGRAINDELETTHLSPRHRGMQADSSSSTSGRLKKTGSNLQTNDVESDTDSYNRYNNSLCNEQQDISQNSNYGDMARACSSTGKQGSAIELGALDSLVLSAISSLSLKIRQSVCDVMVDHAKRLPNDNETRLIVEEIVPQLAQSSARPRSPTSIEEIDQSLYFDLAQTLKNLKKVEQMVEVIKNISEQIPTSPLPQSASQSSGLYLAGGAQAGQATTGSKRASDSSNGEIDRLS